MFLKNLLFTSLLLLPWFLFAQYGPITINFDETAFPGTDLVLVSPGSNTYSGTYDVLTDTGAGDNGSRIYTLGPDGIDDLSLNVTLVTIDDLSWSQTEGDWDDTSNGSFRSDYNISNDQSKPNDWAYVKFDMTFINGLENSVTASEFDTRATSMNGSSEGYEWTQITINGTSINESTIGNYSNLDYSDLSGSTYFDATGNVIDPSGATNFELPNNITMSEFLSGSSSGTVAPGGLVQTGWWAVDDFNTDILDGPEATTVNPDAGNGSVDDNQTVTGVDFGFSGTQLVNRVTYYFGLTDVAFDTDGDGITKTNTLPAAGWTHITLGYPLSLPVEFISFKAKLVTKGVELKWETATEINNSHFIIERSEDGRSFNEIGIAKGNGNSLSLQNYNFLDDNPSPGSIYYRLKQIDLDGAFSYSEIINVYFNDEISNSSIYPYVAQDRIFLRYGGLLNKKLEVCIFDIYGQLISCDSLKAKIQELDISDLAKGNYIAKIFGESNRSNLRFIKI